MPKPFALLMRRRQCARPFVIRHRTEKVRVKLRARDPGQSLKLDAPDRRDAATLPERNRVWRDVHRQSESCPVAGPKDCAFEAGGHSPAYNGIGESRNQLYALATVNKSAITWESK
jgi:hypothetical protein